MPTIFDQLTATAEEIQHVLSSYTPVDEGHDFDWPNFVYTSSTFRRAHLDIVDARESKKLYMMHLCVFPHLDDPSPIFGFDIIAGPNKVTGAFHDFSPVSDTHPLLDSFAERVEPYEWSKVRELPHWAKQIFSGRMVAASNIKDTHELNLVLNLVMSNLDHFLGGIGGKDRQDYRDRHNNYCHWQKKNPHTPKVMAALGLDKDQVSDFIETCLFPEV